MDHGTQQAPDWLSQTTENLNGRHVLIFQSPEPILEVFNFVPSLRTPLTWSLNVPKLMIRIYVTRNWHGNRKSDCGTWTFNAPSLDQGRVGSRVMCLWHRLFSFVQTLFWNICNGNLLKHHFRTFAQKKRQREQIRTALLARTVVSCYRKCARDGLSGSVRTCR